MELQADLLSDAQRAGIDLDLIDTNLALPIEERWRQHDTALRFILQLQKAKLANDTGLRPVDR